MKQLQHRIICLLLTLCCIITGMNIHLAPVFAANGQTTIIMIDNLKSTYQIGERFTATIGVSAPDGSYLTKAWCGFGYNASTMKQLTETDTKDHIWLTSETPAKWLYGSIEFEMTADGKAYFIAGSYDEEGMIEAYRADGSKIRCPRASVLYKIGTGIYTRTSDCNLSSCEITDAEIGTPISFNRNFDKNITEYWADAPASCRSLNVHSTAEQAYDTIILPENLELQPGANTIRIGVQAVSGEVKEYLFHITKPEIPATVTNIIIRNEKGNEIPYSFDPDTLSYDLTVSNDTDKLYFEAIAANETMVDCPSPAIIPQGYSFQYVTARSESEEKKYEFYIFREISSLSLSSLVVETSDGAPHPFDQPFQPDQTEYWMQVPSDVRKATITCTVANPGDKILEGPGEIELVPGENVIPIVVSNGLMDKTYTVIISRDEKVVFTKEAEEESEGPKLNQKEHKGYEHRNLVIIGILGFLGVAACVGIAMLVTAYHGKDYHTSEEAEADRQEAARKKRMKAIEKEKQKAKKEKEKKKKEKKW